MNDRDRRILEHILRHCKEIIETVDRFDFSKENFKHDHVFYNACSMALFQIGELSKRMSEEFKNTHGVQKHSWSSKTLIQKSLGLK